MRIIQGKVLTGFLLATFMVALLGPVFANTIGTVRYVEVIAAHPRMLKFDFSTHRFSDGPSAQISLKALQDRGQELADRLQELNSLSQTGLSSFEKTLSESAAKKSSAEKQFWENREKLDGEIESVRNEIAANIAAMEFGGRTIETTMLPEVNQIMSDVSAAIANAAKARGCTLVLNEALPVPFGGESDSWIEESYSSNFRSGANDLSGIKRWITSADRITARLGTQVNLLIPAISGSVDLTADAVKLLTQPARKGGASKR